MYDFFNMSICSYMFKIYNNNIFPVVSHYIKIWLYEVFCLKKKHSIFWKHLMDQCVYSSKELQKWKYIKEIV